MNFSTTITPYALPLQQPFTTAKGTWTERHGFCVHLEANSITGIGEAAPLPGFSTESLEDTRRALDALCKTLEQHTPPTDVAQVDALLSTLAPLDTCPPSARFAIECALLDWLGQHTKRPIHALLTSWADLPAAQATVQVNATLGSKPAPENFAQSMSLKDQGFSCFKIKVGARPLDEELAMVRAVREAIGDTAHIRLDANGAWKTPQQATEHIKAFAKYNIALVEQPVPADDLHMLAEVTHNTSHLTLIAADEALNTMQDLQTLIELQAAQVIVIKPMMCGGLLESIRLMARANQAGIKTILTTMLEGVVGRIATTQLAQATYQTYIHGPCGLATASFLAKDLTEDPSIIQGDTLSLDIQYGLGVSLERTHTQPPQTSSQKAPHPPLLSSRGVTHGPATAIVYEEITQDHVARAELTYEELDSRVAKLVSWLIAQGVQPQDRVAFCAYNSLELAVLIHALVQLGVCMVPLHPRYTLTELQAGISRARPKLVVLDHPHHNVEDIIHDQCVALAQATHESKALTAASHAQMQSYAMEDRAAILFTSGTTGAPKMAALTWSNLYHSALGSTIRLGHLPTDRWLLALPLCHIGGLSIVIRCVLLGTCAVVHNRFDAAQTATLIEQGEITIVSAVSAMLWQVLEKMGDHQAHKSFRFALVGGGPVPESLIEKSKEHGIEVASTYGMTEGSSQLATRSADMWWISAQTAGPPLLFTEISGENAEEGTELRVRGQTVFEGYLDERLGILDVKDDHRWFATGDWASIGKYKEVRMRDRRRDLIVTGGENVYPTEIEQVLCEQDSVYDACVVGLPDEQWGERVVAVVVLKPEHQHIPVDHLSLACKEVLAGFKVPREILIWKDLPRGSLGKKQRARVRTQLLEERS